MLEVLYVKGIFSILVDYLSTSHLPEPMKKWTLQAVYILLVKNYDRYYSLLDDPLLNHAIDSTLELDWSIWKYNAAARIKDIAATSE